MKLHAKILPEYFELLKFKNVEFRQFESITLENSETHEQRVYKIKDVRKIQDDDEFLIKRLYPNIPWNVELPSFAIELGDEIDSVPPEISAAASLGDRKPFEVPESEKTWHGVGD